MNQLTCELCGGTDFIKQDGVFVCRTCGCKYSLEEARKIMFGADAPPAPAAAPIAGPAAAPRQNAAIDNYLTMAKSALESDNHEEAENYANKVIELDAENYMAWDVKAEAAGWQSATKNNRMNEAVLAWLTAIRYAPEDERAALREKIAERYGTLFAAMIRLRAGNFGKIQSEEYLKSTENDLLLGVRLMKDLLVKGGVSFDLAVVYDLIARSVNQGAVDGYADAKKDFGPEHSNMAKWQFDRFIESCDNCLSMLDLAMDFCRSSELGATICDNYKTIGEDARDAKSYKFDVHSWTADHYVAEYSLKEEAKKKRTEAIGKYLQRKNYFTADVARSLLDRLQGGRQQEALHRGTQRYWETHQEERAKLNEERAQLAETVRKNEAAMANVPASLQVQSTWQQITRLTRERDALGAFKSKEKKEFDDKIASLQQSLGQQQAAEAAQRQQLADAANAAKARIAAIDQELFRPREPAPVDMAAKHIPGAVTDGKFSFTPGQLAAHLSGVLPPHLQVLATPESGDSAHDFGSQFAIRIVKAGFDEKHNAAGVMVYCAAPSADENVTAVILQSLPGVTSTLDADDNSLINWGIIGSHLLLAACESMTMEEAESYAIRTRHGCGSTLWEADGVRFEFAGSVLEVAGAIRIPQCSLILRAAD